MFVLNPKAATSEISENLSAFLKRIKAAVRAAALHHPLSMVRCWVLALLVALVPIAAHGTCQMPQAQQLQNKGKKLI